MTETGRRPRVRYYSEPVPERDDPLAFLAKMLHPSHRLRGFSWTMDRAMALRVLLREYRWSHPRFRGGKENAHLFFDDSFRVVSEITGIHVDDLREALGREEGTLPRQEIKEKIFAVNQFTLEAVWPALET